MQNNPAIVEVQDNREEIIKAIKVLPLKDKLKAGALNYYLSEKKKLDLELEKEMKMLQKKYDKLAAPLYQRANEIIEGSRLPTEDELKDIDSYLKEEEIALKNQALIRESISGYWFKALRNSDIIAQEIREKDEQVLKYLTKIEYIPIEPSDSFSLQFYFAPNEFFSNSILKKTFILKDSENPVKGEGTMIEWKDGKNCTKKAVQKRQKDTKSGIRRKFLIEVDAESFFNFFQTVNLEEKDAIEKLQKEELEKIAERMDLDYDIARMIIDEIIPYSLEYYLGVKINDDYDDIEDLDAQNSNESADDDDEEDEKKKKGPRQDMEVRDKQQECKQQ